MNIFDFKRVAEGYANDRPYYNPLVIEKIRQRLGITKKVQTAIDIGCGTGLSTRALCEIAVTVAGTDSSSEMIIAAKKYNNSEITYLCTPAENIPFDDKSVNLITVVGAINWINCDKFLPEVDRVLVDDGWLIIYDNGITDTLKDLPEYKEWYREVFLKKYPKPPRVENPLTLEVCSRNGFEVTARDDYTNEVEFTKEQYSRFMIIQSNIITAVELGFESIDDIYNWIQQEIEEFIPVQTGTFIFGGYIMYMRKSRI